MEKKWPVSVSGKTAVVRSPEIKPSLKDRLERALHLKVCSAHMELDTARDAIERDWKKAYRKYVGTRPATRANDITEREVVE